MKNQKIDWLSEIKKAGRFAARGFLKFLQVFANVLITIILIGVLTGVIVVSAFSIYIGNYIETEADMSFSSLISHLRPLVSSIMNLTIERVESVRR
jgi:hypothetical protein